MTGLERIIANRRWVRRPAPFPHIVARNVFSDDFYGALSAQLSGILGRGLSERPVRQQFARSIPGYDAYGLGFDDMTEAPCSVFLTAAWRDLMSNLFGIGLTPYMFAGAHHHAAGSKSGFIHNDFNPVWFVRDDSKPIQTPRQDLCNYKTGEGPAADGDKVQVARGVVMILYLLNDGWQPGDGGETALYADRFASPSEPAELCPPRNNSLIMFECTPQSYHAFVSNRRRPRTSIIAWVHRPLGEAVDRFGADKLEHWKS